MQSEEKGGEKVPKNSRNIDPGMKMTQCLKNTKKSHFSNTVISALLGWFSLQKIVKILEWIMLTSLFIDYAF